jgi:hypothetical protein
MRYTISAIIAAVAAVTAGAAPASACGLFDCGAGYAAPVYSGCGCGGGAYGYTAGYERLPTPAYQYGAQPYQVHQYYYVNQGPTFSGPGDFAPTPRYDEGGYSYRPHPHTHHGYHYWGHSGPHGARYGYRGVPLRRYY